jgi:hypothetical protein
MTNKYEGKCKRCGRTIPVGETVVYARFESRGYIYHVDKHCSESKIITENGVYFNPDAYSEARMFGLN